MSGSINALAISRALSLVGDGYIYGAKGQTCSPAFREQQAKQYPEQADMILGTGKKWDGKRVWDCAQLTRAVAEAAGFNLVSGATSQWTKTEWAQKGARATMPTNMVVFLYREAGGKMQHTGVGLGDGYCVHAKGTAYGVIKEPIIDYPWTHWATLWGAGAVDSIESFEVTEDEGGGDDGISDGSLIASDGSTVDAVVYATSGKTVKVRSKPSDSAVWLAELPLGTVVKVYEIADGWAKIGCTALGKGRGYMMIGYLRGRSDGAELGAGVPAGNTSIEARVAELERRVSELEAQRAGIIAEYAELSQRMAALDGGAVG